MQLWQLGLLVVGGICLIVYLVHASGGSRKAILTNEQAAIDRFAEDYPEMIPANVYLTNGGTAAFLDLQNRSVGLVQSFGDCFLTRVITSADVPKISANENRLKLEFADFTFKQGTYDFAQVNALETVNRILSKTGVVNA